VRIRSYSIRDRSASHLRRCQRTRSIPEAFRESCRDTRRRVSERKTRYREADTSRRRRIFPQGEMIPRARTNLQTLSEKVQPLRRRNVADDETCRWPMDHQIRSTRSSIRRYRRRCVRRARSPSIVVAPTSPSRSRRRREIVRLVVYIGRNRDRDRFIFTHVSRDSRRPKSLGDR